MTSNERTVDAKPPVKRRNRDSNVMAAAIWVMSRRGYAGTSIQEIADRVGVLKGSLYHYFSSKEELLFRILQESHAEADRIMAEVRDLGLPPFEELMEFLRRESLWFLRNVDRAHIYFAEARHLTGERRKQTQKLGRDFIQHIHDLIARSRDEGAVRSDLDDALITEYVVGALNSVRDWPTRIGRQFTVEQMADAFVELTREAIRSR